MSNNIDITDCLVLKIEEHDSETNELDTTLFIVYDKKEHYFIVRGKRFSRKIVFHSYSFICEFAEELADFISFTIDKNNKLSYILYNYNNLPYTSNEITYEFMNKNVSIEYEIVGYENIKYERKELLKNLRMLRNVFNYYN
jgi:hypothetical protein